MRNRRLFGSFSVLCRELSSLDQVTRQEFTAPPARVHGEVSGGRGEVRSGEVRGGADWQPASPAAAAFVAKAATRRLSSPHRATAPSHSPPAPRRAPPSRVSPPVPGRSGSWPACSPAARRGSRRVRTAPETAATCASRSASRGPQGSPVPRGSGDGAGKPHSPRVAGRGPCPQPLGISRVLLLRLASRLAGICHLLSHHRKLAWLGNERPFNPPLLSYSPILATETWVFSTQGGKGCPPGPSLFSLREVISPVPFHSAVPAATLSR